MRTVKVKLRSFFITLGIVAGMWLTYRPDSFTSGKEPPYPLNRSLGGRDSRCRHLGKG